MRGELESYNFMTTSSKPRVASQLVAWWVGWAATNSKGTSNFRSLRMPKNAIFLNKSTFFLCDFTFGEKWFQISTSSKEDSYFFCLGELSKNAQGLKIHFLFNRGRGEKGWKLVKISSFRTNHFLVPTKKSTQVTRGTHLWPGRCQDVRKNKHVGMLHRMLALRSFLSTKISSFPYEKCGFGGLKFFILSKKGSLRDPLIWFIQETLYGVLLLIV